MKWLSEFKQFAMRGNVVDMAVGIIIGAAFGKIVSSLVSDVIMPPIGVLLGGVDFSNLAITIKKAVGEEPAVVIGYGKFIQTVIDFVIIALSIFALVKFVNALKSKAEKAAATAEAAKPAVPSKEEQLLTEIRDLLKEKK
ncbi:large-conductance mechanosensitive channel protein MscL [uncultured Rikenella sp.]|uniref:large-conductance mechanosensitive channel protein MscL n=1 Tax=uncultured Rikenella sp. TaxID=368003 RepID=UPI0026235FD7|nr:large-conductance mechanosensitive channel protein MscL [uncultured Rikenella sp.]